MKNKAVVLAVLRPYFEITSGSLPVNSVKIAALLIFFIFLLNCGKSKPPSDYINACIIFSSGDVKISRDGAETTVLPGYPVKDGDRIMTGEHSLLVFQITRRDIVRVSSNSVLEIKSIMNGNDVKLFLEKGEVISKVSRLEKNESFIVQTPTVIAGVRGTEFSVSTSAIEERVAVLNGNVAVSTIADEKKLQLNETLAVEGNTVVIKKNSALPVFITAPISKEERLNISKVSDVEPLPDLNNIKREDLDKKQEMILNVEEETEKSIPVKDEMKGSKAAKIRQLIKEKPKSLEEIKEVFERIDEISMYSGKVISGAIISRGEVYSVLTTDGVITIPEKDVRAVKILK